LGYPILPFAVSHFAFWDVPFHHLGYPISPFGVYFRHICAQCTAPMHGFVFFIFCCKSIELGVSQRVFIGVCCEPFLVLLGGQMLKFIRFRSSKHLLFLV
jgi:hypothetical protein